MTKGTSETEASKLEHPTNKSKVLNWFIFAALAIVALSIGLLLMWSFESGDVLKINNAPFPVRTVREHAEANGVIILNVDYCKFKDVDGQSRISFVSTSREVFLPTAPERSEKGCERREVPIIIPKDLIADKYHIHFMVTYKLNPVKSSVVDEFDSQEFEVVDGQVR